MKSSRIYEHIHNNKGSMKKTKQQKQKKKQTQEEEVSIQAHGID